MALSNVAEFAGNASARGAADKPEEKPSACGSACGRQGVLFGISQRRADT